MISTTRIAELESLGYYVEDMGVEYGEEFEGQFRFVNDDLDVFQDADTSCSESDAWDQADYFAQTCVQ